jgi:hypothetical protein
MRSSNTAKVSSKRRSICARRSSAVAGPPPEPGVEPPLDERLAPAVLPALPADPGDFEPCGCPLEAPEPLEGALLPACPAAPVDGWPARSWPWPAVPDGVCEPCDDACPPGDCWLWLLPLAPLFVCCGGNGDWLPLLDGLELGLLLVLVLVLPPDVDGNGDCVEGDEEPGGCGIDGGDGIDGVCVEVLTAQPARPSAQATGQTRPRT